MAAPFKASKNVRLKGPIYRRLVAVSEASETTQPSALARQLIISRIKQGDIESLRPRILAGWEPDSTSHRISIRLSEANMRDMEAVMEDLDCNFSDLVNTILEECLW